MNGLTNIMVSFGWSRCAVLYSDSEYGNSFAADFQQYAAASGITVALSQKFADNDVPSVIKGTAAIRDSGARIVLFLAQGARNFEAALFGGEAAGIVGTDDYQWISSEISGSAGVEAFLAATADPPRARRLLRGALTLSIDALYGDKRRRFEAAYARADPQAVRDPLVRMPRAGFAPPRTAYDAFAYDAVWATALGLARARADRADLLPALRAVSFYGASGAVAFDPATGDRAAAGLQARHGARARARGGVSGEGGRGTPRHGSGRNQMRRDRIERVAERTSLDWCVCVCGTELNGM
jgi:ABC-type branched-subunit amino acid transport system substrate-binding protein